MLSRMDNCGLAFLCHKRWDDLAKTEFDFGRHCGACSKTVFVCRTRAELAVASALGRCVALAKDNEVIGWIGEPDGAWDWMEDPSEELFIRANHSLDPVQFTRLQMLYPAAMAAYGEPSGFPAGTWIPLGAFTPFVAAGILKELARTLPEIQVRRGT